MQRVGDWLEFSLSKERRVDTMVLLVTEAMGHVGYEVAKLAAAAGIAAYAAWMRAQPEIHR